MATRVMGNKGYYAGVKIHEHNAAWISPSGQIANKRNQKKLNIYLFTEEWVHKNVVCPFSGILFSHKRNKRLVPAT